MSRRKHFTLGQHLAAGQLPMFMTGNEIKEHYGIIHGERMIKDEGYTEDEQTGWTVPKSNYRDYMEKDNEFWSRKDQESNAKVREDDMVDKHKLPGMDEKLSLRQHFEKHGVINPVILETGTKDNVILQGYHRVASNPNRLMPVEHKTYEEEYGPYNPGKNH
jgi:hypothetical protein